MWLFSIKLWHMIAVTISYIVVIIDKTKNYKFLIKINAQK